MDRGDDSLSAVINMLQRDMEELKAAQSKGIDGSAIYPIGSVITFYDSDDHSNHLGLTWERFATGRMVVGYDSSDASFDTIGETGGEKAHVLSAEEMPKHRHNLGQMYDSYTLTTGTSQPRGVYADYAQAVPTTYAGGDSNGNTVAHNNMPPYVVAALWRRTA